MILHCQFETGLDCLRTFPGETRRAGLQELMGGGQGIGDCYLRWIVLLLCCHGKNNNSVNANTTDKNRAGNLSQIISLTLQLFFGDRITGAAAP